MPAEKSLPKDWNRIAAQPAFQELLQAKASFIRKTTVFFLIYYFALLILVGYAPNLMKTELIGHVNLAYLFALSQFGMAWIVAAIYVRKAAEWDLEAKKVLDTQE